MNGIWLLVAIQFVFVLVAARTFQLQRDGGVLSFSFVQRKEACWLHLLIAINLLFVSNWGGKLVSFYGYVSNLGNIFYAFALFAQYLILAEHTRAEAKATIGRVYFVLVLVLLSGQCLIQLPVLPGNEVFSAALTETARSRLSIVAASFFAFYLVMQLMILGYDRPRWLERLPHFWHYLLLVGVLLDVVDSAIFFPIAFGWSGEWWSIALIGVAVKLALAVLSAVFLLLLSFTTVRLAAEIEV